MKPFIALVAACLFVLSGCEERASTDRETETIWFGASDFAGFGTLVEINNLKGNGTIAVYGTAPLHYEFPLVEKAFDAFPEGDGAFSISFNLRGRDYVLAGERTGGVIKAKIDEEAPIALYMGKPVPQRWQEALPGLYEGENGRFLVTPREFGGLRAVYLDSGENFTLEETEERTFFTWQGLEEGTPQDYHFRFPKDMDGEVVALVVTRGGGSETYYRKNTVRQKQVAFNGAAGSLSGTILYPKGAARVPGIVLVHGSGPIYRTALTQQAVMFAEMGFAVLIYDKRGTGKSQGRWQGAGFEDLADDALAALSALERETFVDASRTGFQGHSQAGYILPIAATKSTLADFIIIVNGGSITPWQQSLYDKENDLVREGFAPADRVAALDLMRRVYAYVLEQKGDYERLNGDYQAAQSKPWFEVTDFPKLASFPSWKQNPETLEGFRTELAFDPKVYQRQMTMPVLVLLGEDDKTVPSKIVIGGWRETLAEAGNPLSEIVLIPGAGHGMRQDGGGVFVPEYAATQKAWLARVLRWDAGHP